jgi:hypothetical protein
MKTLKKQLKVVALFFSVLILFQGCTVYKTTPITMEQAVDKEQKVKILTKNNNKLKFKRIEVENGKYYGVRKVDGRMVRLLLDMDSVESIREKDKTLSTILTVAIPVVIIAGAAFLTINNAYAKTGFGPIL